MKQCLVVLSIACLGIPFATNDASASADAVQAAEKRGCCSHHHGVCGCSDNVVICCDKSPSPTCTC